MTKTRDQVIKLIQALRARAADSASTEAEAAIAARKAQQLLEEHNITLTEADVRSEGITKAYWKSGQKTLPVASWAFVGIDKACGTKTTHSRGTLTIYGAPADVEVALYFYDLVSNACYRTWDTFKSTPACEQLLWRASAREVGSAFRKGVSVRLGERIGAQADQEVDRAQAGHEAEGSALVVVKQALLRQELAKHGLKLENTGKGRRTNGSGGYSAGRSAAEDVGLHKGVGSSRSGHTALGYAA